MKYRATLGNMSIVVRPPTVEDDINRYKIVKILQEDVLEEELGVWSDFGKACHCVAWSKGLPFDPRTMAGADKATLKAGYASFLQMEKEFVNRWLAAVAAATRVDDADLGPEPLPDDADPNA